MSMALSSSNGTEFEGRVLRVDYALERQNGSRFGSRGHYSKVMSIDRYNSD